MCDSINEFKKQIIEHPDFEKLVRYAVHKFNLKNHMRLLKIDYSELYHLVRCEIWTSKSQRITEFQVTTVVVHNTMWYLKRTLHRAKNIKHETICDTQIMGQIDSVEENSFREIDAKDFIEEMIDAGLGFEIDVLLRLSSHSPIEEYSKILGRKVTRQRIGQIRKEARKKTQFAAKVIYGQECYN